MVLAFLAAAMVGCGGGSGGDEDGGGGGNPGGGNPGTGTGGSITNSASEAWIICEIVEDEDTGEESEVCSGMSFRSGGKLFVLIDYDTLGYGWVSMEVGTWSTSGSRLNMTFCGESDGVQYSVSGNKLTMYEGNESLTATKRTGLKPTDFKVVMAEMLAEIGVDPSLLDDLDYCDYIGDDDGGFLKSRAEKSPQKIAKSILSKIKK
jgi:hypothetical protein